MGYLQNKFKINNKGLQVVLIAILILCLSALLTVITLMFSTATWNFKFQMFQSYFKDSLLLFMNFVPILITMLVLFLLINRLYLSFLITSIVFVTMSFINKFKLTFRDDPFSFIDIKLIKESMEMADKYSIRLNKNMIILIICLIFITILLKLLFNYKLDSKRIRIIGIFIIVLLTISFRNFYFDTKRYNEIGDKSIINIWSQTQQFQSKGFIYPFIYSIKDASEVKLEGYNEKSATQNISKMSYFDIPEDKKVNIIAIMLEAYNDFSKFDTVDFKIDPYKNFHKIQAESICGNLITNIFAGDTIQTERSFITGYFNHPKYFRETNSFIWYFKEQGYYTEAMHPIYGWFYNRRNINQFLGFDNFDYYENKYKEIKEEFYNDDEFFDFIINNYKNARNNNTHYFNFTVTYQNHGPYSNEKYSENQFLEKKSEYDEETYNIINNYLAGISETDEALLKLFDSFRNLDEPTVVVIFGDHNPWLGKDAIGYDMMGINLDLSTVEGFKNYFETPYIIWGNESAKKTIGKDFKGIGKDISPNFLMAELFEYLNWQGNEYMQYLMNSKRYFDVLNKVYFKENDVYTPILSKENQRLFDEFKNVEYYWSHKFIKR